MVQAIKFAVRNSAGGVVQGATGGEESNFLQVGSGEQVSLHLAQSSVVGYERKGADLLVKLVDGQTIELAGFFDADPGRINRLYLSADGEVSEVLLQDSGADGVIYASYGPVDAWNKFSTLDDIRFAEGDNYAAAEMVSDEPAGMGFLAPGLLGAGGLGAGALAAGLIGGAALLGGDGDGDGDGDAGGDGDGDAGGDGDGDAGGDGDGDAGGDGDGDAGGDGDGDAGGDGDGDAGGDGDGDAGGDGDGDAGGDGDGDAGGDGDGDAGGDGDGDGDGDTRAIPTVDDPESSSTLTTNTEDPRCVVTGTGEPGDSVTVVVGDQTQTTTINEHGTWGVTFEGGSFPADGSFRADVTVTGGGFTHELDGPSFVIDMTPPDVSATSGVESVGDIENGAEYLDGVTIGGEGEAGATIEVQIDGQSHTTVVDAEGNWSVTFTTEQIASGEHSYAATIIATDPLGNQTVIHETVVVDTVTAVAFAEAAIAGDNVINAAEAGGVITMTGTAEAGATVSVEWLGTTVTAVVTADGAWSADFAAGVVAGGTYSGTVATVTSVDAAGNSATATHLVDVDTEIALGIDAPQMGDDYISAAEHAASAGIVLTGTGEAGADVSVTFEGITRTATVGADGTWSVSYASGEIATGTREAAVSVTTTDAAGNTATATHTVTIDTEVQNFGGLADDLVTGAEAANDLIVSGTVEVGSRVVVQLASGAWHNASVDAAGNWSVQVPAAEIPAGEHDLTLTMVATDHIGNTRTLTQAVHVDTLVRNLGLLGEVAGDGVVNAAEYAQGVELKGTVEANSDVTVTLENGTKHTVHAGADGSWSLTLAAGELPVGNGIETEIRVSATDSVGNVDFFTETILVDTVAPMSPEITAVTPTKDASGNAIGMRALYTEMTDDIYTFDRVDASGAVNPVAATETDNSTFNETEFRFGGTVPDGSYLVINNADAAGNSSSTLLIVNTTNSVEVDLDRAGLGGFDFAAVDLTWAPDAQMTLTADDLTRLTGPDHQLIVKGDAADDVNLSGDFAATGTQSIEGQTYTVYTLGDGHSSVLIDDDIHTTLI